MTEPPSTSSTEETRWPMGSAAESPPLGATRQHPDRIGSYQILGVLGRGGMGVVYKAQQQSPSRAVALKILPGGLLCSDRLIRRFEHEAEILARLHHPGIAQVYEAGTANSGFGLQPFFAMELVEGQRLTEFVAEKQLPLRQRLELLARICDAVQYAHQQGVIHRDLKPGNVLVESSGQIKILDFGVARAAEPDVKWTVAETEPGLLVGTLPYMSPEQASGDTGAIDTRSDVYALGVIAYELLADRLPHQLTGVPLPDAVRMIREDEPPRLRAIRGACPFDVETIVAKAMHKEKERRYGGAAEMAADIRRFLNDEPIAARPSSVWYHLRKFGKRNQLLVGSASTVLTLLLTGAVAVTVLWRRAELQRQQSVAFSQWIAELMRPRGDDPAARTLLERAATQLPAQPLPRANVCKFLAEGWALLGSPQRSVAYWRQAADLRRKSLGEGNAATVEAVIGFANALQDFQRPVEAEHQIVRARSHAMRALGKDDPDTLRASVCLARSWAGQRRLDEAERLLRHTLRQYESNDSLGPSHRDTISAKNELGCVLLARKDDIGAAKLFQQVLEAYEQTASQDELDMLMAKYNLGTALAHARREAATSHLTVAVNGFARLLGPDNRQTLRARENLATAYVRLDQHDRAQAPAIDALQGWVSHGPEEPKVREAIGFLCFLYTHSQNPKLIERSEELRAIEGRLAQSEPAARPAVLEKLRALLVEYKGGSS